MKALITGDKGFVGQHLSRLLESEHIEVFGYDIIDGHDIRDFMNLKDRIGKVQPDYIFHLAALTSVPESFEHPSECMDINVIGSLNILQAVEELGLKTKVLLASSTEAVANPTNPYAVSKIAMESLGRIYADTYGLHVVSTQTSNHTGPGQEGPFAVCSWAKQIVAIERGEQEFLEHGDLSTKKQYLDVRDVVEAYLIAVELEPDTYVIASDEATPMKTILNDLVTISGQLIFCKETKSLTRAYKPTEVDVATSFLIDKQWKPKYKLNRTLRDTLEYWRSK